jgi:hypothetical protein
MYSLLAYLGGAVILLGIASSILPGGLAFGWQDGLFLGLGIILVTLLHFAYLHRLTGPLDELPPDSVVFALAFEPQDEASQRPGLGNRHLAGWLVTHTLVDNAPRILRILTQEAILWALEELGAAHGYLPAPAGGPLAGHLHGVEVQRMHRHRPGAKVRGLEAVCCALERFGAQRPPVIVLVAHDKQYERAHRGLRSLYAGQIVNPGIQGVPYRSRCWCNPLRWALRELFIARPLDFVRRTFLACACPAGVALGPLASPAGSGS